MSSASSLTFEDWNNDNDDDCAVPEEVAAAAAAAVPDDVVDVIFLEDNNNDERDLKLHGVNPKVAPVRAAVLVANDFMLRKAFEGVASVAKVDDIPPPNVRTAVDTIE